MEINQKVLSQIFNDLGLKANKDLGQNFLVDPVVCERIANSLEITKEDLLLEVGGGLGSLTHFLVNKSSSFDVVDLDTRMTNFLESVYKNENISIINEDIRKVDVSKYTKIIGNLPYYITTELVTDFMVKTDKCTQMVFMIQTEAVNRFVDVSGKDYGPISVLIHLLGNSKRLFSVKAGCFCPIPKCGSTVFKIEINNVDDRERMLNVYKMTKSLFLNRRKTILNNLNNYTGDKEKSKKILQNLNILETKRPEELSPNQYLSIYNELHK